MKSTKINASQIDLTIFEEEIIKLSFDLFRDWTKSVQFKHKFDLTIVSEQLLVEDVKNTLKGAFADLFSHEKYIEEKENPRYLNRGWSVGYILGRVKGFLLVHWYQNYITPHTEFYKRFIAIRSVAEYLKFDKLTEINIDRIYEDILKEKQNLANIDVETRKINFEIRKNKITTSTSEDKGKVVALFENLAIEMALKMPENRDDSIQLDIEKHLDDKVLKRMMRHNEEILGLEILYR
jgi:hypothetical protein